jgi:hypothetical protein
MSVFCAYCVLSGTGLCVGLITVQKSPKERVCVCMCVCARARVYVRVCMCARARARVYVCVCH